MTFEEWWETHSGWGGEMLAEGYLAEAAWNAAVSEARGECCKEIERLKVWHKVEDILPEKEGWYIGYSKMHDYVGEEKYEDGAFHKEITHWRHWPEPPKE